MDPSTVKGLYDALGARYDRWTQAFDSLLLNGMRRALLARADGEVLEVAVGTGKNFGYYPRGCRVTGLDASAPMLAAAAARARRLGVPFELHRGDAARLPFDDARFDTVVCTMAGCTFTAPGEAFAEIRRVCRPGGRALFLEHVRPVSPYLRALCRTAAPLTMRLLGCDPDRDTVAAIERAGLRVAERVDAIDGVVVALTTEP